MGSFIGLLMFVIIVAGGSWLLINKRNNQKTEVVAPSAPVLNLEEKGNFLGAGNDMGHGVRPLWKFSHEANSAPKDAPPVAYYGKKIEFWTGKDYANLSHKLTVEDSLVRTPTVSFDDLYKPKSDVKPDGCVFHGAGGSLDIVCVLKYSK